MTSDINSNLPVRQIKGGLTAFVNQPGIIGRIKQVLSDRAPQFASSLVSLVSQDVKLADCMPGSILAAAMTAAVLDLPIQKNLGFAWIIPYGNQAQFQLGYKGLIQLALRSGQYARLNATTVNEEAVGGWDEVGERIIDWGKIDPTKPPSGYAFAFKLVNGFTKIEYWSKEKVEAHARRFSQAFRSGRGTPWQTDFDAMALKTVIKNTLSKWGILSVTMQKGMEHDQGVQGDIDAKIIYPDADIPEPEAPSREVVIVPGPENRGHGEGNLDQLSKPMEKPVQHPSAPQDKPAATGLKLTLPTADRKRGRPAKTETPQAADSGVKNTPPEITIVYPEDSEHADALAEMYDAAKAIDAAGFNNAVSYAGIEIYGDSFDSSAGITTTQAKTITSYFAKVVKETEVKNIPDWME